MRGTTGTELYDLLEYDALYPPISRNDMEEFFAILVTKIHNGTFTQRTTPEREFPGIKNREVWQSKIQDKIRAAAKRQGKPLQVDLDEENRKRAEAVRLEAYMARLARKGVSPNARGIEDRINRGEIR